MMGQFFWSEAAIIGTVAGLSIAALVLWRRSPYYPKKKRLKGDAMLITTLRVVQDIEEKLQEAIANPAKLLAHASRLNPVQKNEQVIGTVESDVLRALWVVMIEALANSRLEMASVDLSLNTIDAEEHKYRSFYLDMINDAVAELFWVELKAEVKFRSGEGNSIGVREGWKVVLYQSRPEMPAVMRAFMGPVE